MPSRLEIHECSVEFCDSDDDGIAVGGFVVWDSLAAIVRYLSMKHDMCERWIETWGHKYPEPEDDDLS